MGVETSLPALLEDLRALRAEVDEARKAGRRSGGDPLTPVCNDLCVELYRLGGLNERVPPQRSGRAPTVERLHADMQRWRAANEPRETSGDPIRRPQVGWRY